MFVAAVGAFVAAALSPTRATACSFPEPPPALVGTPVDGALDVPTNVIPVYDQVAFYSYAAGPDAAASAFELLSPEGVSLPFTLRPSHVQHFELVPVSPLEPRSTYLIHVTLQPLPGSTQPLVELDLSFTTGDGPTNEIPPPPSGRIQHYTAFGNIAIDSCSPGPNNSCVFFQTPGPMDLAFVDEFGQESEHYLVFDPWTSNLTGIDQGTNYRCVRLRARAPDGALSGPTDLCQGDGETFRVTGSLSGIECTPNGLTRNGVPIGQAGSGGSSGTEPDDGDSRTVVTEGCGCSVPGSSRNAGFGALFVASLFLHARRRAARPSRC